MIMKLFSLEYQNSLINNTKKKRQLLTSILFWVKVDKQFLYFEFQIVHIIM